MIKMCIWWMETAIAYPLNPYSLKPLCFTVEMIKMCIWWMETAIAALPEDKSQITFLFDRTGICIYIYVYIYIFVS
jgi:hypothetical protein